MLSYIVGNPPFVGHQWRNAAQVADMERVWGGTGRFHRLDYVTCWFRKAAEFISDNPKITVALVATNSISQGEQVGTLWESLFRRGVRIHFAHRTFQWENEARGKAAVHCVIIGFGLKEPSVKVIFDYATIKSEPHAAIAKNINPYLVDAPDVLLPSRSDPRPGIPQIKKGSQPTDGGHLILTDDERRNFLSIEPGASKWLRPYMGGDELIASNHRWCLWLKETLPIDLKGLPHVRARVMLVRQARLKSPTPSVREFADHPTLFTQDRQPTQTYIAVPEVSSENRRFIPIAFLSPDVIASNKLQIIVGGNLYHFGLLNSTMHMAWVRSVAGRMKSDYSYSPAVYNNLPWPTPTSKQAEAINAAAQSVLDARSCFPATSLADLYDIALMPTLLVKAHAALDRVVDAAYGRRLFSTEAERVSFLFERYQTISAPLAPATTGKKRKRTISN